MTVAPLPALGVVIVSFNSSDVILDCLESLLAATGVDLHIVVVDNASTDGTPNLITDWAAGQLAYQPSQDLPFSITPVAKPLKLQSEIQGGATGPTLTLLHTGVNAGFAGGVNVGLEALSSLPKIDRFYILNPDSIVPPQTPAHFANHIVPGGFSLMGGRVTYVNPPDRIQSDGGVVNRRTGVTSNLNFNRTLSDTDAPAATSLDFIPGSSMVVSRAFYEKVGPMTEDYFLYYEEVDWALRRGDMPLAICPEARIYHHAGTSIGSPTADRIASSFSIYFLYRARLRFMQRFFPERFLFAWVYALLKAVQLRLKGHKREAGAICSVVMRQSAPAEVRNRLSPEAAKRAFATDPPPSSKY